MAQTVAAVRDHREGQGVYGWLWSRLPGPTALRAATMVVIIAGVALLLVVLVFPMLRPTESFRDGTDPLGPDTEQVVEPDGVRSSPLPQPDPAEPSPVIPEDQSVPQQ
jgi:hypothetical protein